MSSPSRRESRAVAQMYARAGLIASEYSLVGLGAASLLTTLLFATLADYGGLQLLRPGLAVSAGLLACGAAISVVGRWLDLGGSRHHPHLARSWSPLLTCALLGAAGALLALHRAAQVRETAEHVLWPTPLLGLFGALALLALILLTLLGVRSLLAMDHAPTMPVVQLWQATTHGLLGGAALVGFIGLLAETLPHGLQAYVAMAICVMCGHAALSASVLLHRSRKRLRTLRDAGERLPLLERGHALASATLLLGVVVPGLAVLAHLLLSRDVPLIYACLVLAFSNHPMRYALVLLPMAPDCAP